MLGMNVGSLFFNFSLFLPIPVCPVVCSAHVHLFPDCRPVSIFNSPSSLHSLVVVVRPFCLSTVPRSFPSSRLSS